MKAINISKITGTFLSILAISSLFMGQTVNGMTVVCRMAGIAGFDKEQEQAKKTVGKETTQNVRDMKVYVTYSQKHLYVYSNFISEGADYQTKIVTDQDTDLLTILSNLVFFGDDEPTAKQEGEFREALGVIKFYVQSALDSSKYKTFRREIEDLKK